MKIIFLLIVFSFNLKASVWEDNQSWSLQYEEEFSKWIQSSVVSEYIFVNPKSPYYGIYADCADSSYALRAIFSYEHKLPFAIHNPSGDRATGETLNNRQSTWDGAGSNKQRLIAMINEIASSTGTANLAFFDTYPITLKSITSGTLFMTQTQLSLKRNVRHTYNIKNINPVGSFDVIYSSENIEQNNGPMIRRKDKDFDFLPIEPYGFRKFRWPEHLGLKNNEFPAFLNASNEQYTLGIKLGKDNFFKLLKKTIATVLETEDQRLKRAFDSICIESKERIVIVNQAQKRLFELKNVCMDYNDFDIYSTPSRDIALRESFFTVQKIYSETKEKISPQLKNWVEAIFQNSTKIDSELLKACPINYRDGVTIDLGTLWRRIYQENLSSHPNDKVTIRWGEVLAPRTQCKIWY